MKVKGEMHANIMLKDNFNNSIIFAHKLLVITNLRHDIFLGNDILSTRVYATTQTAVIFNKIQGKTYNMSRIKYNPNFIILPYTTNEKTV